MPAIHELNVDDLRGRPVGRVLVKMGKITRDQVHQGLEVQKEKGGPLGQILIDLNYIDETSLTFALAFQAEPHHVPPVWPPRGPEDQQMQLHLEIEVEDLAAASAHAESCGAPASAFQPQDDVRVHVDPAGHPFCLYLG